MRAAPSSAYKTIRKGIPKRPNTATRVALGLQHGDVVPRLRQLVRGRQPRQTGPDDDHSLRRPCAHDLLRKARERRRIEGCRGKGPQLEEFPATTATIHGGEY